VAYNADKEKMMKPRIRILVWVGLSVLAFAGFAKQASGSQQEEKKPFYQVTMVGRTITAINYQHRSGATKIDFQGTPVLPLAKGEATVESKQGRIQIDARFRNLQPAQRFGTEYVTYVLWAITPEGKPSNLGEVLLNGTNSKLSVTTPLQSFGLIVTAEPYFAVTQPSDVVVLENALRADTRATSQPVSANYELIQRGQYTYDIAKAGSAMTLSPSTPIEVYEARNAVLIAEQAGADKYAAETFAKAQASLAQAETLLKRKANRKEIVQASRDAVQTAADARAITLRRREDERSAQERAAGTEREARSRAEAEAAGARQRQEEEARRQADIQRQQAETQQKQAEAQQKQAEAQQKQAEAQKQQAEREAAREAQARAEAEAASQAALRKETEAREAAAKAEREKQELRSALLEQFNRILPTRDTPRGLMVNMSDVLFDIAKYNLRPAAREALAKLSGIVLGHPGLKLEIEGHTDSTGSDEFNQKLSEQRADSVRSYLIQQGLSPEAITSSGFGPTMPVGSNSTATGRQQNRRVEIIVSGEVIGTKITGNRPSN
jgi:outer membrane protein OmpA-like peptidoglycan-associated protein